MKNSEKQSGKAIVVICGCLCLFAVGAAVLWQSMDYKQALQSPYVAEERGESRPVTLAQTQTVDETALNANVLSQDDGETAAMETPVKKAKVAPTAPVFSYPVEGDIVMPYSVDSAIFDPTLEQYRTSDAVSISAEAGCVVFAAEKGTVKEITKDEEKGNSVAIAHENGWLTTYSQLADQLPVKVGETVSKGQAIGAVGEPTKYTIALGSHVEFAMEKDGERVNPAKTVVE